MTRLLTFGGTRTTAIHVLCTFDKSFSWAACITGVSGYAVVHVKVIAKRCLLRKKYENVSYRCTIGTEGGVVQGGVSLVTAKGLGGDAAHNFVLIFRLEMTCPGVLWRNVTKFICLAFQ